MLFIKFATMAEKEIIHFGLVKIETEEFSTPDNLFVSGIPIEMRINLNYSFFKSEEVIKLQAKCGFYQINIDSALIVAVSCHFNILSEDWANIYSKVKRNFTLPRVVAVNFANLTIGAARGVLHSKTENTPFNSYIILPLNTYDLVPSDVVVNEITDEVFTLDPPPS
jgi:hypothetical protein